jgi:hypothetical protein
MAAEITAKQREAIEAMEAARREGCTVRQYAQKHGLNAPRIYALLSALRKQGVLPKLQRRRLSRFVAVKLQPAAAPSPSSSVVVCRLVCGDRYVIECLHWPPESWLSSLRKGTDAAA